MSANLSGMSLPRSLPAAQNARKNPYVGPRAFESGEMLYGRDQEIRQLKALLIAERIVMLHSPSGAGKTSLIQAGLVPQLRSSDFNVLPIARVNQEIPEWTAGIPWSSLPPEENPALPNRYLLSTLLSLEEQIPPAKRIPLADLARLSLDEYLTRCHRPPGAPDSDVLIFDAFEQILTVAPNDREGKQAFFAGVGAALRNRNRWALFAIREDYVAALAPFVRPIPGRFGCTFRLDLLSPEAARDAIQNPAREQGVEFTNAAARQLIDDLRTTQVQLPDGGWESQPGLYVEPVQLQVVCFRLWQAHPAENLTIDLADLERVGDVDQSLAEYYESSVRRAASLPIRLVSTRQRTLPLKTHVNHIFSGLRRTPFWKFIVKTGVQDRPGDKTNSVWLYDNERAIRQWVGSKLIAPGDIRAQVLMRAGKSDGLDNRAIQVLEDAHLVRSEKRAGATWFELSHDRLIQPVMDSNAAWLKANLKVFQQQAALWASQGRPDGLLLRGEALAQALQETIEFPPNAEEAEFLEACQKAQTRARGLAILLIATCIALAISLLLAWTTLQAYNNATVNYRRANEASQLAQIVQRTAVAEAAISAEQRAAAVRAQSTADADRRLADLNAQEASIQSDLAKQQANLALVRQLVARARTLSLDTGTPAIQSGLLAVEAARRLDGLEAVPALHRYPATASRIHYNFWVPGPANAASFSADHKRAASGSSDGTIQIWDVATGEKIKTLNAQTGVRSLAVSADGQWVAAGGSDASIRIFDVSAGLMVKDIKNTSQAVSLGFSPDRKYLLSEDWSGTVQIWDTNTGIGITHIRGALLTGLTFSPDSKKVAIPDRSSRLVRSIPFLDSILWSHGKVDFLSFSPDGRWLAGAGSNGEIRVWEPKAKITVAQLNVMPTITGLVYSPDGSFFVTIHDDQILRFYSPSIKDYGYPEIDNTVPVKAVRISADGARILTLDDAGIARWWDTQTGQMITAMMHEENIVDAAILVGTAAGPQKYTIVTASRDGQVLGWQEASGKEIAKTDLNRDISVYSFSPDGQQLIAGSKNDIIRVWDASAGKETGRISYFVNLLSVAISPDGKYALTGSEDKTARVWDVATAEEIARVTHSDAVQTAVFSPDGSLAASGSRDGQVMVWNPQTGQILWEKNQGHGILKLAFSPDGGQLVCIAGSENPADMVGSASKTSFDPVIIRDAKTGAEIAQVKTTARPVQLAFRADSRQVAVASQDGTVLVVETDSGMIRSMLAPGGGITALSFSPDGGWLLSSNDRGIVQIWDPDSEMEVAHVKHDAPVWQAIFSRDGKWVASAGSNGILRVWEAASGREITQLRILAGGEGGLAFGPDNKWLATFVHGQINTLTLDSAVLAERVCLSLPRNLTSLEWKQFIGADVPYRATCANLPEEK